jgi:hypothetical protein
MVIGTAVFIPAGFLTCTVVAVTVRSLGSRKLICLGLM